MKYPQHPRKDGISLLRKSIYAMSEEDFLQTSVATGMTLGQMLIEKEGQSVEMLPCWMIYVTHGEHKYLWPVVTKEHYYGERPFRANLDEILEYRNETDTVKECRVIYSGKTYKFRVPLIYLNRSLVGISSDNAIEEVEWTAKDALARATIDCEQKVMQSYHFGATATGVVQLTRSEALFQNMAPAGSQCFCWQYAGKTSYNNYPSIDIGPVLRVLLDNTNHVIRLRLRDDFLVNWETFHEGELQGVRACVGDLQITHLPGQGEKIDKKPQELVEEKEE